MNHTPSASDTVVPTLRFSAREWPEPKRMEAIRELYGRTISPCEIVPVDTGPVDAEAKVCAFPGLGLARMTVSNLRFRRTPQYVFNDAVIFSASVSGSFSLSQCGREVVVGTGEATLITGAEPIYATSGAKTRFMAIKAPFKAMAALVPDLNDRAVRIIRRDVPALRLLMGYADLLQDEPALAAPELQHLSVTHLYDIMGLALGATRDAAEIANARGGRAARLQAVVAGIEQHLANPALSATWLGVRLGLSERYVHHLLAGMGLSFSELVRHKRVERARRMLEQPSAKPRRIVDVALAVGFGDLSNFNRAFRQRFGCTPSDVLHRR